MGDVPHLITADCEPLLDEVRAGRLTGTSWPVRAAAGLTGPPRYPPFAGNAVTRSRGGSPSRIYRSRR